MAEGGRASDISFTKFFDQLTGPDRNDLVPALAAYVLPETEWSRKEVADILDAPEFDKVGPPAVRNNRRGVTTPLISDDNNHPSELGKRVHSSLARRFYKVAAKAQQRALKDNGVTWQPNGPPHRNGDELDPDFALFITAWDKPRRWGVNNAGQIAAHITSSYKAGTVVATEVVARAAADHILRLHKTELPCAVEADLPQSQLVGLDTKIDYIFAPKESHAKGVVGELKTKWGITANLPQKTGVQIRDVTQAFVNALAYSTPVNPRTPRSFMPEVITIVIPKTIDRGAVEHLYIGTTKAFPDRWEKVLAELRRQNRKITDTTRLPLNLFVTKFLAKEPLSALAPTINGQLSDTFGATLYQTLYTKRALDLYAEQKLGNDAVGKAFKVFLNQVASDGVVEYKKASNRTGRYAPLAGIIVKCTTTTDGNTFRDTLQFQKNPVRLKRVDEAKAPDLYLNARGAQYYCGPPGKGGGHVRCLYRFRGNKFGMVGNRRALGWHATEMKGKIDGRAYNTLGELNALLAQLYYNTNAVDN